MEWGRVEEEEGVVVLLGPLLVDISSPPHSPTAGSDQDYFLMLFIQSGGSLPKTKSFPSSCADGYPNSGIPEHRLADIEQT